MNRLHAPSGGKSSAPTGVVAFFLRKNEEEFMNELKPKLFEVMKGYTKAQAIRDIISGIIVAIIALPLSIALAIASGVGPEQGLYTAIIAGFFIAFLLVCTGLFFPSS